MAKKCRKSSKCPEPFNTLIDIAAGVTMNAIANKMEAKHHYRKRGVPNPYRATAFGLSTGKLKNTEDLIRLGGFMGAMGAFDPDDTETIDCDYSSTSRHSYDYNEPLEFDDIDDSLYTNDNRYAWRMNFVDGSEYGIDPEDYETRDGYNDALLMAMDIDDLEKEEISNHFEVSDYNNENRLKYTYCKVARLDNGVNDFYLSDGLKLKVGDLVEAPTNIGISNAIITYIQEYSADDLPKPLDKTENIIRKVIQK